ncbi:DNA polymerase III subunit delta' [Nesterenkonia ebinurensis]|uniref:DNA polymerase III subunit delta' n=1 Tax=Nesterenkonia ebinurensis TaxID=2608252 RepID=UPI001CC5E02A|nr:DNA polymerase III subunit delta' [Nesterenkonia ebinurensis]
MSTTTPAPPAAQAQTSAGTGVFAELVGQSAVVEQLRSAVASGMPTHAWLFTGPPGSGRSNAARAFAAALNCEQGGCGQCQSCRMVAAGAHPAVQLVSTENVTYRIDDVRELITTAQDRPQGYRWRVIVMEDADRMTERATNVLLKSIEEPPPQTVWVLCAPSPADVLVTIRSRCRPVSLRIPPTEEVAALLVSRDGLSAAEAEFSARISQNHIGVARRLAADPQARSRREQIVSLPLRVRSASGAVLAAAELVSMAQTDAEADSAVRLAQEQTALRRSLGLEPEEKIPAKLRSQFKRLEDDAARRAKRAVTDSLDRTLIDLTAAYRDVLSIKLGTGAELINQHLSSQLAELAEVLSPEQSLACLDALNAARVRITQNVPPTLAMEALMMQLIPRTRRR